MARGASKRCVDCEPGVRRKATYPGPRCFTHHKAKNSTTKARRQGKHLEDTYGITEEDYQELLKFQGGVCYICRKRPGRKRLSVDHDHKIAREVCGHHHTKGCKRCIRGLLHSKCNSFLGWIRDEVEAFERGKQYLLFPPARVVFGGNLE